MSIRSIAASSVIAGVLSILAVACSAAPESTTETAASCNEALTNSCLPKFCMTGHHWSQDYCECLPNCVDNKECMNGSHWDPETCQCAANCVQKQMCMAGQDWDATVCHCNGVSKADLRECVFSGACGLHAVMQATRASTGCGSCKPLVKELVDRLTRERGEHRLPQFVPAGVDA